MLFSDRSCNKWITARIETILEELLNIEYGDNGLWIPRDSEYIAPHNTMQARQQQFENEGSNLEAAEVVQAHSSDPRDEFY